ncbi:MAG: hypothetical protein R3B06_13145 [Kofleriaceae bacterium]
MTNNGYAQTQCPSCGATTWAMSSHAVPCQTCGRNVGPLAAAPAASGYNPAAYGAPGQAAYGAQGPAAYGAPGQAAYGAQGQAAYGAQGQAAYGAQGQPAQPAGHAAPAAAPMKMSMNVGGFKVPLSFGSGGPSKLKIFGGIALAIVLAIGGVFVKMKFGTGKGMLSYASLGVDRSKPDADALIAALAKPAEKWKRDAMWWSANFQSVDAEGRVDVSKGAEVVYISEHGVASASKSVRSDSVKKYGATASGVSHKRKWGATNAWEGVERHADATCGIKDVMALVAKELPAGKTARVTFDPKFADYYAWRVLVDNPKIDRLYAFSDCAVIK